MNIKLTTTGLWLILVTISACLMFSNTNIDRSGVIGFNLTTNDERIGAASDVGALDYVGWNHFVATYDTKTAKLFHNNGLVGSNPQTGPISGYGMDLLIGALSNHDSLGGNSYTKGVIDDIRIYNRALTLEEINALYNE